MIYVKIICRCGQKYAFEVEPANGRMPAAVHCPVCRTDGTAAANEIIAQKLGLVPPPQTGVVADDSWQQRAMEAERRAEQAVAALRANMAGVVKDAVVQELAAQRRELLQAQQSATLEITQLMRRLDDLQAPLQERLRVYETRIQELERDLAVRTEENRELLKIKIEMLRQQLAIESSRSRPTFN